MQLVVRLEMKLTEMKGKVRQDNLLAERASMLQDQCEILKGRCDMLGMHNNELRQQSSEVAESGYANNPFAAIINSSRRCETWTREPACDMSDMLDISEMSE